MNSPDLQNAVTSIQAADASYGALQSQNQQLKQQLAAALSEPAMRNPHPDVFGLEVLPTTTNQGSHTPGLWVQPGDTGGTGGGTALPHGTWSSWLNSDGSRRWIMNPVKRAAGQPWDTFYWYTPRMNTAPRYTSWTFNGSFFIRDLANWEAIETDCESANATHDAIDLGSQFLLANAASPVYRIWDYSKKWIAVPSVVLTPQMFTTWLNFSLRGTADWTALTMTYNSVVINGQEFPIGITTGTVKKPGASYCNYAWQADSRGQGQVQTVDWRGMELLLD
jgi:hypothetical protein